MNRVEVSSAKPRAPSVSAAAAESVSPVSEFHQTVLLDEAVEALAIRPDGCYIDDTSTTTMRRRLSRRMVKPPVFLRCA